MLLGTSYTICADHKPLVTALSKISDDWTSRQQRHLSTISEISTIQLGVNYQDLSAAQLRDPEIEEAKTSITNLRWKVVKIGETSLLCDISTGTPRPFVPKCFRRNIFEMIHTLSLPSIRATVQLVTEIFACHAMKKDIAAWTRTCISCQRSKIHRHTKSSLGCFQQPTRRFGHIHVDIVGPLNSEGKRYMFTIIDGWPEAIPMEDATTVSCATALLNAWVSRFGLPEYMTIRSWLSLHIRYLVIAGSAARSKPTPHNVVPPSGERNGGEMAQNTESITHSEMFNFGLVQPATLSSFGASYHAQIGLIHSSAEIVYGHPLVVPGEFFPYDSMNE